MVDGKLVTSGGMVVKNVAGLDFAKLMIGSFGTLAAIASVNFKLIPIPETSRTLAATFLNTAEAAKRAAEILRGQWQPVAMDIHKDASGRCTLLLQAAGSEALVARYERDFPGARSLAGAEEAAAWAPLKALPYSVAATIRVSATLSEVGEVLAALPGAAVARASNGVVYGAFDTWQAATAWAAQSKWSAVLESADEDCPAEARWPNPPASLKTMQRIKEMFDPKGLLNRGRLYGRI
jgi:glycolate oxidase FAD binding subunit